MRCIPLFAPCNLAVDTEARIAVIQYGGPVDICVLRYITAADMVAALYAMAIHRLDCFQAGPYACEENAAAARALREAVQPLLESDPYAASCYGVHPLDGPDPHAGGACHRYQLPHGQVVQYQHGPRGVAGSVPGVFDDAVFAILEAIEPPLAQRWIDAARRALAQRVADRMRRGVLGVNAS